MNTHLLSEKSTLITDLKLYMLEKGVHEDISFEHFYRKFRSLVYTVNKSVPLPSEIKSPFYRWEIRDAAAVAVVAAGGKDLPEELQSTAALVTLINPKLWLDFPSEEIKTLVDSDEETASAWNLVDSVVNARAYTLAQAHAKAKVALERWSHVNLMNVIKMIRPDVDALRALPENLQKEAYILLGEYYYCNTTPVKGESKTFHANRGLLRSRFSELFPFITNTGINLDSLNYVAFLDIKKGARAAKDPNYFYLQRVEQGAGVPLAKCVENLDEFITAYQSGRILHWIQDGENRDARRLRALSTMGAWQNGLEATFIEGAVRAANANAIITPEGDEDITNLKMLYIFLEKGDDGTASAIYGTLPQWARVLSVGGKHQKTLYDFVTETRKAK